MNREGAETYLRRLAEAELRRATTAPGDGGLLEECHSARLEFVALALHAAHAFDMGAANEIQAGLDLALGLRQPRQGPGGLTPDARAQLARLTDVPRSPPSRRQPPSPRAPERVVRVGRVIRFRTGDVSGELHLLTYVQTAAGARFTAVSYWDPDQAPDWHRPPPGVLLADRLTPVDDRGTRYRFSTGIGPGRTEWSGMVALEPNPPRTIRWLDFGMLSGEPGPRIVLTPPSAESARALRIISGHGITARPAGDLPEPWLSLLDYRRRGTPERAPVPGWAVAAAGLPELDGARVTVLGLHNGTHGQFLHLLTSGVTSEYTWRYGWIADRLPVLWLRDRDDRWHTARPARTAQLRDSDDFLLWLRVVPPLDHGTPQADLVATGLSAEVRARLPLTWSESRPSAGPAARS